MKPHGLSPWRPNKGYPPTFLGAEALRCVGTKASEGYPPVAESAEATSFNTQRFDTRVTHSSTGKACGLLRRRIKFKNYDTGGFAWTARVLNSERD